MGSAGCPTPWPDSVLRAVVLANGWRHQFSQLTASSPCASSTLADRCVHVLQQTEERNRCLWSNSSFFQVPHVIKKVVIYVLVATRGQGAIAQHVARDLPWKTHRRENTQRKNLAEKRDLSLGMEPLKTTSFSYPAEILLNRTHWICSFHWLPIKTRIQFKTSLVLFKFCDIPYRWSFYNFFCHLLQWRQA